MTTIHKLAPKLQVSSWLNTDVPIALNELRGRVVVIHAFQMLCPGCVSHGLPQANLIRETFSETDVAVIGLHTVFEHHDVMNADALKAFIHEYRLTIPIGIDSPSQHSPVPHSMQSYGLRGTPSLIVLDKQGRIRLDHFGRMNDLAVGSVIGGLVSEDAVIGHLQTPAHDSDGVMCDDTACRAQ